MSDETFLFYNDRNNNNNNSLFLFNLWTFWTYETILKEKKFVNIYNSLSVWYNLDCCHTLNHLLLYGVNNRDIQLLVPQSLCSWWMTKCMHKYRHGIINMVNQYICSKYEIYFPGRYFDEISQDTGKYCFGVDDSLKALEMGAVETLIVWENLDIMRYVLKNHQVDGKSSTFKILCNWYNLCIQHYFMVISNFE